MKYERFEDLPVWRAALDLAERTHTLTCRRCFNQPGDLCDQLRRAALSVSNNIAEGFEQGTTSGLLSYLYIARGSAGEVRSMLHFCRRLADAGHLQCRSAALQSHTAHPQSQTSDLKSDISNLKSDISNLKSDISNLKSEISDAQSRAADLKSEISDLKSEISNLLSLAESCSRQIRAWADSLQNSGIKGQRHLTDKSHAAYVHQRTASAFWQKLEEDQRRRVAEWTRQSEDRRQNAEAQRPETQNVDSQNMKPPNAETGDARSGTPRTP